MAKPDYRKNGDAIRWAVHSDCISRFIDKDKGDLRSPCDECKARLYDIVVKDHNNMQSLKLSILLCYQNATTLNFFVGCCPANNNH